VCDVDLEAFMLRDGRGESVEDVVEGWEGMLAQLAAYVVLANASVVVAYMPLPMPRRAPTLPRTCSAHR
jgi:hypothetical protein